jgi:hypothetical protein
LSAAGHLGREAESRFLCVEVLLSPPSACRINFQALLPDPWLVEFSPIAKLAIFEWHELIVDALGEDKPVARADADVKCLLVKDGSVMYGRLGCLVSIRPVDNAITENPATESMLRIYARLNGASRAIPARRLCPPVPGFREPRLGYGFVAIPQ